MILDRDAFREALRPNARLLGLDLGTKRIGVAVSDRTRFVATPMETLKKTKFTEDAARLKAICEREQIAGLVVGLPVNMDGTEGPRCQSSRQFVRNFSHILDLPTLLWDERLSTVAAERTLLEADLSRAKRGEVIDRAAAAFILQGALDALRY